MDKRYFERARLGLALVVLLGSFPMATMGGEAQSWRSVENLLPHELDRLDLRGPGPRDSKISYIPAEPYPFSAPFTVEEMTYRAMEFTQHARWSSVIVDVYGSMTGAGYLDQGITITYKQWVASVSGVQGQIETAAGESYVKMIHHFT